MMILFGLSGIKCAELHGDLTQAERLRSLQQFRDGDVDILLCTDVAARGIDVEGVHAVINYEMPKDITTYVHRVGRTARAGRKGRAVTLTSESRRLISKQVARHCHGVVKSRAVPPHIIAQWVDRIGVLEQDIKSVMQDERMERKLKDAEREMTRAQNLIEHKDEIFSRPARTWFQSEAVKQKIKRASNESVEESKESVEESKGPHKMTRKKRRRMALLEEEEKMAQHQNSSKFTSKSIAAAARKSKKQKQQQQHSRGKLFLILHLMCDR